MQPVEEQQDTATHQLYESYNLVTTMYAALYTFQSGSSVPNPTEPWQALGSTESQTGIGVTLPL
jgi:hypothetical protein